MAKQRPAKKTVKPLIGRPPKSDAERRDISFPIRLSPVELAIIKAASPKPSTWARETLLAAAAKQARN